MFTSNHPVGMMTRLDPIWTGRDIRSKSGCSQPLQGLNTRAASPENESLDFIIIFKHQQLSSMRFVCDNNLHLLPLLSITQDQQRIDSQAIRPFARPNGQGHLQISMPQSIYTPQSSPGPILLAPSTISTIPVFVELPEETGPSLSSASTEGKFSRIGYCYVAAIEWTLSSGENLNTRKLVEILYEMNLVPKGQPPPQHCPDLGFPC